MSIVIGATTAATRVLDSTLSSARAIDAGLTPLERARERIARARARRDAIDALEKYGDPLAILVGLGAAHSAVESDSSSLPDSRTIPIRRLANADKRADPPRALRAYHRLRAV